MTIVVGWYPGVSKDEPGKPLQAEPLRAGGAAQDGSVGFGRGGQGPISHGQQRTDSVRLPPNPQPCQRGRSAMASISTTKVLHRLTAAGPGSIASQVSAASPLLAICFPAMGSSPGAAQRPPAAG